MADTTFVRLPQGLEDPFEVFVNGVPQIEGIDYHRSGNLLRFQRRLAHDRVSGWRWLVGAFGIGTYRQDDSIDLRYRRDGHVRVTALAIDGEESD